MVWIGLRERGITISQATVSRWLVRLGLNRRRWFEVDGEPLRKPGKITARYRGHMVHLDIKKVGKIRRRRGLVSPWPGQGRSTAEGRLHLPPHRDRQV